MNTALQIISIQHELVLAIGNSLDLKTMLQQFLHVCNARLELKSSHIFIFNHLDDLNNDQTPDLQTTLTHYLSFPGKNDGISWKQNKQLTAIANKFISTNSQASIINGESESQFHCSIIESFGILITEHTDGIDISIQNSLAPVLKKLAICCQATMNHQALIHEIEARRIVEDKILYQASHDHLTGLFNRGEIESRLSDAITECEHHNEIGALLLIDLVDFKNINDVMGHNVGDEVICQLADKLKKTFQPEHTVARFGGDEFMILLTNLTTDHAQAINKIEHIIEDIISTIEEPVEIISNIPDAAFSISCVIGFELFNDASKTAGDIIKHADVAMYEAAKRGHIKALCFEPNMSKALDSRLSYLSQIKKALANNEFELHYQPQFDNQKNIIGAEALLRWNNPVHGYVSPAEYIPIAEESDLIVQIGNFVLHQACKDIKILEQMGLPDSFKKVSINVSARQLAKIDFVENVLSAVNQENIKQSHLGIEITEGIMVGDIEHSINILEHLRQYNIECAIDDFGTGYSSLTYLKRLPASLLKIDRAFVIDIHKDNNNYSIANMIIGLGKSLNMAVIAEGVENQEELDCLIDLGCFQYQGFFFSKPLPLNNLIELMHENLNIMTMR